MSVSQSLKRQLKNQYSLALLILFTITVLDAVSTSLILSLFPGTSEANPVFAWIISNTNVATGMTIKIVYTFTLILFIYFKRAVSHVVLWGAIVVYILSYSACTMYQF